MQTKVSSPTVKRSKKPWRGSSRAQPCGEVVAARGALPAGIDTTRGVHIHIRVAMEARREGRLRGRRHGEESVVGQGGGAAWKEMGGDQ
jgi:hypothetical protein